MNAESHRRPELSWGTKALVLVATVVAWLAVQVVWLPGQTLEATRFIFQDAGAFLYAIDQLSAGQRLYADLAWQYGPLALAPYALVAALAGNSAVTLLLTAGIATGATWCALIGLAARKIGFWPAWLGGTVWLLPAMTGPCVLSSYTGPHAAIEALVTTIIVLWVVRAQPTNRGAAILGLLVGVLRLVRFGPDLVVGCVAFILWTAPLWTDGRPKHRWRRGASLLGAMAGGYAAIWLPYAIWLKARLAWPAWLDQVWPTYLLDAYRKSYASRWPSFDSLPEWSAKWIPVLGVALLLAITGLKLRRGWRALSSSDRALLAGLAFFPLTFFLGAAILFRIPAWPHANVWMIWPALALPAFWAGTWRRWLVLVVFLPAAAVHIGATAQKFAVERDRPAKPLVLPNGQTLWFQPTEARYFATLSAYIHDHPQPLAAGARRKVLFLFAGSGVHFYLRTERVGRHAWYLQEFVRPWEHAQVLRDFCAHELFLPLWSANAGGGRNPAQVGLWIPLPPAEAQAFLDRLVNPQKLPGAGVAFEIAPPSEK